MIDAHDPFDILHPVAGGRLPNLNPPEEEPNKSDVDGGAMGFFLLMIIALAFEIAGFMVAFAYWVR